jgi:hypothetical protein
MVGRGTPDLRKAIHDGRLLPGHCSAAQLRAGGRGGVSGRCRQAAVQARALAAFAAHRPAAVLDRPDGRWTAPRTIDPDPAPFRPSGRHRGGSSPLLVHHDHVTSLVGDALRRRCIQAVVEEGEQFGVLAQHMSAGPTPIRGGLAVPVPWVPEWTAPQLVGPLGTVHRWATALRAGHHTGRAAPEATQTPPVSDHT